MEVEVVKLWKLGIDSISVGFYVVKKTIVESKDHPYLVR